ncbi:MAG TPA: restriction endonuclease subunit S [Candidatus Rifleibacterium sp.]|nr:restriction endonuclease subunit S [Candidatus Rifleibacterium sp.]HPT47939.1 restriction endonuclease subunit S [Candidatus Rifleibacterium sp.]
MNKIPAGYKRTEIGIIPEDWDIYKLSELVNMKSGVSITSKHSSLDGKYPCYGGNGLRGYTDQFTHSGRFALIGRQGALCGNVQFVSGDFFASEHAIVVTSKANTQIKLLYYVLIELNLNQYSESSAQPGLSVAKILDLPLPYSANLAEQTAIATIITGMETEIEALEARLAKYKQIKQGMMQTLLTGKIRLL